MTEAVDAKLRALGLHCGPDAFDPVMMMAVIGAEAYDAGDTVLALAAFRETAHYVRPKLQATQIQVVPDTPAADILGAKERFMTMVRGHDHPKLEAIIDEAQELGPTPAEPYLLDDAEVIDHGD